MVINFAAGPAKLPENVCVTIVFKILNTIKYLFLFAGSQRGAAKFAKLQWQWHFCYGNVSSFARL